MPQPLVPLCPGPRAYHWPSTQKNQSPGSRVSATLTEEGWHWCWPTFLLGKGVVKPQWPKAILFSVSSWSCRDSEWTDWAAGTGWGVWTSKTNIRFIHLKEEPEKCPCRGLCSQWGSVSPALSLCVSNSRPGLFGLLIYLFLSWMFELVFALSQSSVPCL